MDTYEEKLKNAIKDVSRIEQVRNLFNIFREMIISASNKDEINEKGFLIEKVFHEISGNHDKLYNRIFQIIFNPLLIGTHYHINDEYIFLCKDKNGDRYLSLSNLDKFRSSILRIIEQRFDDGFYTKVDEQYDSILIEQKEYPVSSVLLDNQIFLDFIKKNYSIYSTSDEKKKCFGMINFLITKNEYNKNPLHKDQIANAIKHLGSQYNGYYFWSGLLKKLKSHHIDEKYNFFKEKFGDVYCNLVKLSEMPLSLNLKKLYESECQEHYSSLYQIVYHIIREKDDYNNCSLIKLE